MNADRASHLSLILDLSPAQWHLSSAPSNPSPLSLETFLSHVLTFVNSHIASKPENTLAVFGALPGKSVLIHSSEIADADGSVDIPGDPNSYRPFKLVDSVIAQNIETEIGGLYLADEEPPVALVGALTKALCHINRTYQTSAERSSTTQNSDAVPEPRILILSVSPDLSASYIPIMNSIFSAQKLKVTIDICKVFGPDTVFLQQVSHLTGGSYIHLEQRDALLQFLIMSFLSPPFMREVLAVPKQDKVDFRAACFCHKNIVDIAFVCSVCLSIFCSPVPVCTTCRTKFPIKSLQRLQSARPFQTGGPSGIANGVSTPANGSPKPRPATAS
ncbi:Tfb4-domain-containing protein [Vararia minispora EC-137]|uniref:Tfb4-domain-containing protein n=1 Tax=Vararia minispora EC-137 TaxID=1314806 RepID=A0ACB8Q842_9AGAM|nr:Tfb4-domain-containing protein [Vararia minispora EC-137]